MTKKNSLLVSVGLPIYNGEKYIRQALDSLLAQDYENFEIIISNNASIDATQQICREYALKYPKIRYYQNEVNLGAVKNFKRVLDLSSGIYFMWAAHDDIWKPEFVSACVEELHKNPGAVLCATNAILIDDTGKEVGKHADMAHTLGMPKLSRLKKVIRGISRNTTFYGVYRKDSLAKVPLLSFYGSDHVFMANLSIFGEFIIRSESYFLSRVGGAGNSVQSALRSMNLNSKFMETFPNISFFVNYLGAVVHFHELSFYERWIALLVVVKRFTTEPYPRLIKKEILEYLHTNARKIKGEFW